MDIMQMAQSPITLGGLVLIILFYSTKAIYKLYTDLRHDSAEREKMLSGQLDKFITALNKISGNLSEISQTMKAMESSINDMNKRICNLEEIVKK